MALSTYLVSGALITAIGWFTLRGFIKEYKQVKKGSCSCASGGGCPCSGSCSSHGGNSSGGSSCSCCPSSS
ncbi:hypothetical protein GJ688_09665 [Heliobacillus mobilis]|uniref:FeoB-associated Cys-rich membrane protein n=1 Tax=Heliobacterium mobile TaxID=28064 RepID=A0A6I3SK00_HELMO|nr:hypothetical protein [Heliobacterium mobile]MTV49244.1 hypothetical protein [Heliobacterium mobile]